MGGEPKARFIETDLGFTWQNPALGLVTRWIGAKKVMMPIPRYTKDNVVLLRGLIENGQYRAVIDRRYPLDQVIEATRYVERAEDRQRVPTAGTDRD